MANSTIPTFITNINMSIDPPKDTGKNFCLKRLNQSHLKFLTAQISTISKLKKQIDTFIQ